MHDHEFLNVMNLLAMATITHMANVRDVKITYITSANIMLNKTMSMSHSYLCITNSKVMLTPKCTPNARYFCLPACDIALWGHK